MVFVCLLIPLGGAEPLFFGEDPREDQFLQTASFDIHNITIEQTGHGLLDVKIAFDHQDTMQRRYVSIVLGGQNTIELQCNVGADIAGQPMQEWCRGHGVQGESFEDGVLHVTMAPERAFVEVVRVQMQSAYTIQNPANYAELGGPEMDQYESQASFQINASQKESLWPLEAAPKPESAPETEAKESPMPFLAPLLLLLRPRR